MRTELAKPEDAQFIKDRVAEVKAQHLVDLQRLYDAQAGDYIDVALDKYYSKDELIKGSDPDQAYSQLEVSILGRHYGRIFATISTSKYTTAR